MSNRFEDISEIIDYVIGSESELSDLSSDDEVDEWQPPGDDSQVAKQHDDNMDIPATIPDDEGTSIDHRATVSEEVPHGSTARRKEKPKNLYKFDKRRAFVPPSNLEFTDAPLQPEPKDDSPYNYFKYFVTSNMFEYLAEESNHYAHQKAGFSLQASACELETFVGLFFHMGLVQMPAVGCYWETYIHYNPIADVMSRQRFQKLASYMHIANNLTVTEENKNDKVWKIRRWCDDLNSNFLKVSPSENQCIDEVMVAFKGRSILKQYLPKKPRKWGFKLWARCSSTGFLHVFDIYQGKNARTEEESSVSGCGLGGNVVLKLCSTLPTERNFKVFADNFFSNFEMVAELERRGLHYVGTINNNRLHGAPLKSEKELKKQGRGSEDSVVETTRNLSLVRWYDNKCVTMISSYIGNQDGNNVQRYDRSKKQHISVNQPSIIAVYNKSMGGVDLMDMLCSLYKYKLRSKRWYIYIFYHTLTIALVNAWLLYRRDCKILNIRAMPLRKFQAMVAFALCNVNKPQRGRRSIESARKKRKKSVNPAPVEDVQFDGVDHLPIYAEKRQRCRKCTDGFSLVMCGKCKVHLCLNKNRNCYTAYHRKTC